MTKEQQISKAMKECYDEWNEQSRKLELRDKMVDLRMHLANAEIQANKVIGLLPTKYGLPCKVRWHIQEADDELCEIARKMGLDKIDLVKPRRVK